MLRLTRAAFVGFGVLVAWTAAPQERPKCRSLDPTSARRFLPDRVPLEAETILVDGRSLAALEFPDKSRVAVAPLLTSGHPSTFQQKYEFILVSETRLVLGRWNIPAGMVGIGLQPEERDAPTRLLIARDFSGAEIERISLVLDASVPPVKFAFVPKGEKEFELRFGSYVIEGRQK